MATCGYLCPACEGKGYDENGKECGWCTIEKPKENKVDLTEVGQFKIIPQEEEPDPKNKA